MICFDVCVLGCGPMFVKLLVTVAYATPGNQNKIGDLKTKNNINLICLQHTKIL